MKNLYLLFACVFFAINANSQSFPIDFSTTLHSFSTFNGSQFSIISDPDNSSNSVGELKNSGTAEWEGGALILKTGVDLVSPRIITLRAYNFNANQNVVLFKFEDGTKQNVELTDTMTAMGWQTLTFDFNKAKANYLDQNTFVATGSYKKVVIFLNGGVFDSGTVLLDDIDGGTPVLPPSLDTVYTDLVWADEFDGFGNIDTSKWFHQTQLPAGGNWFNGEEQHYTNKLDNSFLENGFLKIVAKKEIFNDQGETKNYTSARLNSKYAFTYGRIDARAKLPSGNGTWPAIWTLGQNIIEEGAYWSSQYGDTFWPYCGEIDVMEHWGNNPGVIHGSLHTGSSSGATVNTGKTTIPTVSDSFHVYSMNWSPNQISFMVDGEIYYTYNPTTKNLNTWPYFEPQFMLLNIAMGGIGGAIDPNFTESTMEIDYVRVYQNISTPTSTSEKVRLEKLISLYPNPTNSSFQVIGLADEKISVEIFDLLGKVVFQQNQIVANTPININFLQEGYYSVILKSENKTFTKKLIKY